MERTTSGVYVAHAPSFRNELDQVIAAAKAGVKARTRCAAMEAVSVPGEA